MNFFVTAIDTSDFLRYPPLPNGFGGATATNNVSEANYGSSKARHTILSAGTARAIGLQPGRREAAYRPSCSKFVPNVPKIRLWKGTKKDTKL